MSTQALKDDPNRRNVAGKGDAPKVSHYHLGGRHGGGGLRGIGHFFKEHRLWFRRLLGLLLIALIQRLFRSFLFTCPCLPAQGPPLKGNKSLVVISKTEPTRLYYPPGYEATTLAPLLGEGHFVSDHTDSYIASPEPDPRAPPPGSPLKLATDTRYSRTKAELRDANTRFRRSYGLIFLLVPAACLFLFKLCISTKPWKLLTGCCRKKDHERTDGAGTSKDVPKSGGIGCLRILTILGSALIPALFWIVISLMDARFLVCAYSTHPCNPAHYNNREVKAKAQIIGWILLISLTSLIAGLIILKSLCNKRNFYEDRFAKIYDGREENEVERVSRLTAKALAVQNVANFFNHRPAGQQRWWEKFAPSDNLKRTLGIETRPPKVPKGVVQESSGYRAPAHLDTGAPGGPNDESVRFLGNDIDIAPSNVAENLPGDYYMHEANNTRLPPAQSPSGTTGYQKLQN